MTAQTKGRAAPCAPAPQVQKHTKAIIELGKKGKVFGIARNQLAAGRARDYHLSFESARMFELGPIERRDDETVFVPFDEIDIRLPLAAVA